MTRKFLSILAIGTAISFAAPALADTPGVTVSGRAEVLANAPFTLGYSFTTTQSFTLTGLGVFDDAGDGLFDSHDIGLWDTSGTLLASITVGSGTAGTLISGFRFASVAPIALAAGDYRVGALFLSGSDPLFFPGSGTVTSITGLTYNGSAYVGGGTLADPTVVGAGDAPAYIGGNVLLGAVPEPATWAMMLVGFGAVGFAMRRRRTSVTTTVRFA